MADTPPAALAAAERAIIEAATDFGRDDVVAGPSSVLARAALEAAAPILAEAWGAFECEPQVESYRSAVRSVPCPSCGARVGEMCRTAFVGHAARKRALQAKVKEAVVPFPRRLRRADR